MVSFGDRLAEAIRGKGNLCVGIDPHPASLSDWNLPDSARGVRSFSFAMLEAAASEAAAIKPQSAFFERLGSAGIEVLEDLVGEARSRGILTILDVKRGDIGSTMAAYADAYLRVGAPIEVDAITVSPFLGWGSLEPALSLTASGKGLFVLCLTSNPEGGQVQLARYEEHTVAATIATYAAQFNAGFETEVGPVGLVVGATSSTPLARSQIALAGFNGPLLVPGLGSQGATPELLGDSFGPVAGRALFPMSRGLSGAGPDPVALSKTMKAMSRSIAVGLRG